MRTRCVCGCGRRAVHDHHVVYRQELKRLGGDVADRRNLVPVAVRCHGNHHSRSRPLRLGMLPDAVFEFVGELLGPAGYDYLRRRYAGEDARVDALLARGTV